ncbi:MAG: signal peptidase II [Anaerolineae bacterium]
MSDKRWYGVILPGLAIVVYALDQLSKYLVLKYLSVGHPWNPVPLLRSFVSLTHVTNSGAAFGLFPGAGLVFTVIAIVVAVAIIVYYRYLPKGQWLVRLSLGLQLGGALGNLTDRLRYGYVIDFVDFKVWPIFNLADAAIVIGVAILAYLILQDKGVEEEAPLTTEGETQEGLPGAEQSTGRGY